MHKAYSEWRQAEVKPTNHPEKVSKSKKRAKAISKSPTNENAVGQRHTGDKMN